MDIFNSTSLFDFQSKFNNDDTCKEYVYHYKWTDGFTCSCGHTKAWKGYKPILRYVKIHTVTSNTIFHDMKFGLLKTFYMIYEMATTNQILISTSNGF